MAASIDSLAFLLAQVGGHASMRFKERIAVLDLIPPHVAVLGFITRMNGPSQQSLAERLGIPASRMVVLVDELLERDLIERTRNDADRRQYVLKLTRKGDRVMRRVVEIATEHEKDLVTSLSSSEQAQLTRLLRKIADQQQLIPGVHPGLRSFRRDG